MLKNRNSKWVGLCEDLKEKLESPLASPAFVIYFIIAIVFAGLIGVALTVYIENKLTHEIANHEFSHIHITMAFASYSVALLTASSTDLILSTKESETKSIYTMFGVGSIIFGLTLMCGVLLAEHIPWMGYILALIGLALAWFIWWITNSQHPHLTINPNNAIPPADNLKGDESKFKLS